MTDKKLTGYPSIDKPWLKYYSEEAIHAPLPEGSMYDYMTACNAGRLDEPALNYFGRKITYRELVHEIDYAANAFSKAGIQSGSIVAAFVLNTPECIASIYALNRLGAVIDLQYVNLSPKEVLANLQATHTQFILTADSFLSLIEGALELGNLGDSVQVIVAPVARSLPPLKQLFFPKPKKRSKVKNILHFEDICRSDDCQNGFPIGKADAPALIVHTSGTTGVPKGVLLSSRNVNAIAVEYKNSLQILRAGDTILNIAPPFVAFGICLAIHAPLCLGLQVCLSPSPDPETNGKTFAFYKPTYFLGGPAHIRNIIQVQKKKRLNLSFVQTIGYGGESISNADAEQYVSFFRSNGAAISHLTPGYGMTEFGGTVVLTGSTVWREGSVGVPFSLANVKIVDPDSCDELPYGSTGEIWMTSPSMMLGYYQNPDEDSKVMVTDKDGTRWLRTGDLGEIDRDGFLFLRGRIKRIYLAKGRDNSVYKMFPDYIERVIRECSPDSACAVVTRSDDGIFYIPVAFIVGEKETIVKIRQHCESHLPEYMVPSEIRSIDHIPSTATGKADYHLLESIIRGDQRK